MDETKQTTAEGMGDKAGTEKLRNAQSKKSKKKKWTDKSGQNKEDREVLIKVAGIEYRAPGKRTRVLLGGIVLGGNLLLVLAALLYFYNPAFKDFIYTVGR